MKHAIISLALLSSSLTACGSETDKAIANYINSGKLDTLIDEYQSALGAEKEAFESSRKLIFTQLCQLKDVQVTQSAYDDGTSFLVLDTEGVVGGGAVIPDEKGDFFLSFEKDEVSYVVQWLGGRETTPALYDKTSDTKAAKSIGVAFSCTVTKPI